MEARNTVIMTILKDAFGDTPPVGAFQATTGAYKAGIREVVEFCEENEMPDNPKSNPYPGIIIISKACWQTKLKEWGL